MTTLKTSIYNRIKSNTKHNLEYISLEDLIDNKVLLNEFTPSLYKDFLKDNLDENEEEENQFLRYLELFKRDTLVNFTNPAVGKEIVNLANNFVYDQFNEEYYNSFHNLFKEKNTTMDFFLLTILLNNKDIKSNEEEVNKVLQELKNELSEDPVSQQKILSVFSIINQLKGPLYEKNYDNFFKLVESYINPIHSFIKESPFTIFLVRNNLNQFSEAIVNCLIKDKEVSKEVRSKAIISLLKLGKAFKCVDLYLDFVDNLLSYDIDPIDIKKELEELIDELYMYAFEFPKDTSNNEKIFDYSPELTYSESNAYATDGIYIYIYQPSKGLFKVGSGYNNTILGRVYHKNDKITFTKNGCLVYVCGKLYFRNPETTPDPFKIYNPTNLKEEPVSLKAESMPYYFMDQEPKDFLPPYQLKGHFLKIPQREEASSQLATDQRYLYLLSKVGELELVDKAFENYYLGNVLYNLDVIDPLDSNKIICSFPLAAKDRSNYSLSDSIIQNVMLTDGRSILLNGSANSYTLNLITRKITNDSNDTLAKMSKRYLYDYSNSIFWTFQNKDNKISASSHPLNINQPNLISTEYGLPSNSSFAMIDQFKQIYDVGSKVSSYQKSLILEFFSNNKKQEDTKFGADKNSILSILLNVLSIHAQQTLNYSKMDSKVFNHMFKKHVLILNPLSVNKLTNIFQSIYNEGIASEKETKYYMISSTLRLINCFMKQIELLGLHKTTIYNDEYGSLKNVMKIVIDITNSQLLDGRGNTSLDLVISSMECVKKFVHFYPEFNFPDLDFLIKLLDKDSKVVIDLENIVTQLLLSTGDKLFTNENIFKIISIIENLLKRNDENVFAGLENICEYKSDLNRNVEFIYFAFIKHIFKTFTAEPINEEDAKNIFSQFEIIFKIIYNRFLKLFQQVDMRLCQTTFKDLEEFYTKSTEINKFLFANNYTFRFFYASISLINTLSTDKHIIFKSWPYFFEFITLYDKSIKENSKIFKTLDTTDMTTQELYHLYETSHPVRNESKIRKIFDSDIPSDIYIEFSELSNVEKCKFTINYSTKEGSQTKEVKDKQNIVLKDVIKLDYLCSLPTEECYGMKVLFHNRPKYSHHFNKIYNIAVSIVINSIKSFFFFNHKGKTNIDRNIDNMLQSKLFSGGLSELLDFESSSNEYQEFLTNLKNNKEINYDSFNRILSQDTDIIEENDNLDYDVDEIILKENFIVENFIAHAQKVLRPRFPWINVGGENGDKLVRAIFAITLKQERLYNILKTVSEELIKAEEETTNNFSKIENLDLLLLIWSEVSRIRQWYMEQIKDLAEADSQDFDRQNEDFVNTVINKAKFLFSLNAPTITKHNKTFKFKFFESLIKSQNISNAKIENDIVKANAINWKKMQSKGRIQSEGRCETESIKKNINSVLNCLKNKVTVQDLVDAIKLMNTKAKFREISLSLINAILVVLQDSDTKLFIVKSIVESMRKLSGKRFISIDEGIKSSSSVILSNIQNKFHTFIKLNFSNLLNENSVFYISGFLDCLSWNLKARDYKILQEINFFQNLYLNSPNEKIKNVWDATINIKIKTYKKNTTNISFDEKLLSHQLLEYFEFYSSMICSRVVEETHRDNNTEPDIGFYKKKSSVFDNSYEKLIRDISNIVEAKLTQFVEYYSTSDKIITDHKESYLNLYLLLIYKFNVNHSENVIKYMRNPDLLSNMLVLFNYASTKNKYSLSNIFKIYLVELKDEDIYNLVYFLKKNKLFSLNRLSSEEVEALNNRKLIIYYLLNTIYNLRSGIFNLNENTTSDDYEDAEYIVSLLRALYTSDKWRTTFDESFIEILSKKHLLMSSVISILNGDNETMHYGSEVNIKHEKQKNITEYISQQYEESNNTPFGHIIGFHTDNRLKDSNTNKLLHKYISTMSTQRKAKELFALVLIINEESYNSNKIKNNDIEIQTVQISLIEVRKNKLIITNPEIVKLLVNHFNESLIKVNAGALSYLEIIEFNRLSKSFISILDHELQDESKEYITKCLNFNDLINLVTSSKNNEENMDTHSYETVFNSLMKNYLMNKKSLSFNLNKNIKENRDDTPRPSLSNDKNQFFVTCGFDTYSENVLEVRLSDNMIHEMENFKVVQFNEKPNEYIFRAIVLNNFEEKTVDILNNIFHNNFFIIISKDQKDLAQIFCFSYVIMDLDESNFVKFTSKFAKEEVLEVEEQAKGSEESPNPNVVPPIENNVIPNLDNVDGNNNSNAEESKTNEITIDTNHPFEGILNEEAKVIEEPVSKENKPQEEAKTEEPIVEENKPQEPEDPIIEYTDSFETIDFGEKLFKLKTQYRDFTESRVSKVKDICEGVMNNYLRSIIVNYLNISQNDNIITEENYSLYASLIKKAYLDTCLININHLFSVSNYKNFYPILIKIITKEQEFKKSNSSIDFLNITNQTGVFSSYSETKNIEKNIQTELIGTYIDISNQINTSHTQEETVETILFLLKITRITATFDCHTFNHYLVRLYDKINYYFHEYKQDEEGITSLLENLRKNGYNALCKFMAASFKNEKDKVTERSCNLFEFIFKISRLFREMYKQAGSDKRVTYDHIEGSEFSEKLKWINMLYYKTRDIDYINQNIFSNAEVREKLSYNYEIPSYPYIYEVVFEKEDCVKYEFNRISESADKMLCFGKYDNGYTISEFIGDDKKQLNLNKGYKMIITNKSEITNEIYSCGYNDYEKLAVPGFGAGADVYVPTKVILSENFVIKAIVNCTDFTLIVTMDGRIFVAGEGCVRSGLAVRSNTYTSENKWNDIAKNEKVVNFYTTTNSGYLLHTEQNFWVAGCNDSFPFGEAFVTDFTPLVTPFPVQKCVQVALGTYHSMFRIDDGSMYGMGCNCKYELNFPNTDSYIRVMTKMDMENKDIIWMGGGSHYSLFLAKEDGINKLYSCGGGNYGQNGQGNNASSARLNTLVGVTNVDFRFAMAATTYGIAITQDNKLYTWGENEHNQLGHGIRERCYEPKMVQAFAEMEVIDATINNKNLLVRVLDKSTGKIKLYSSGYNGYGAMGINNTIENYNHTFRENPNFSDKYVSAIHNRGITNASHFVVSNADKLIKPFEFTCKLCNNLSNESLYVLKKNPVCSKCFKNSESNIALAIRKINIANDLPNLSLPDLKDFSSKSDEEHSISCFDCDKSLSGLYAYIPAEDINKALCEQCYDKSKMFYIPKFVYIVKKAIDYTELPKLSTAKILRSDNRTLKYKVYKTLSETGIIEFKKENKDIIDKTVKLMEDIKDEYFYEYLQLKEGIKDEAELEEKIKKSQNMSKLLPSQISYINTLCIKIDPIIRGIRNLVTKSNGMLKDLYLANLPFLNKNSRNEIINQLLEADARTVEPDSHIIKLSRSKAIKFKQNSNPDYSGSYTMFGQIWNKLKSKDGNHYKARKNNRLFKVELIGEGATDAGGPFREMMDIMCDELQSVWLDLFIPTANNKSSSGQDREKWTINPDAKSSTHLEMFNFLGRMMGYALRSANFLNLDLPAFFWKQLLKITPDMNDIERIDIHTANYLNDLMNLDSKGVAPDEFEYIYDQTFTTILSNGKEVPVEYKGEDKKVTYDNAKEYVKLAIKTRINECENQITAIRNGLFDVINPDIALFTNWKDLETRVCGSYIVDLELLKTNTYYEYYDQNDPVIKFFWKAFERFTNEERILYLKFVWGRSRLPINSEGFERKHGITTLSTNYPDISLPVSHTCFFKVDIPRYSTEEILYNKFIYAIKFCTEIDNDFTATGAMEDI